MSSPVLRRLLVASLLLACVTHGGAVDPAATQVLTTQPGATATTSAPAVSVEPSQTDLVEAQYWGITLVELQRARLLMRGPRGAFSDPRISPVEILGIHAYSDEERNRYAAIFARLLHEDTQRVLAWQRAGDAAMRRLYPSAKVMDFGPGAGRRLPNYFFTPGSAAQ